MAAFPSGTLSDFLSAHPSSSGGSDANFTLAHELLGLPSMSQGFSAKVSACALRETPSPPMPLKTSAVVHAAGKWQS